MRRARGLTDLVAARYSVVEQISGDPKSWYGIQNIAAKETDYACLYISVGEKDMRHWILKATRAILFSEEDRSLHDTESMSLYHENHALLRDCDDEGFKTNLHLFHNLIIALVAALLKEPEIIIVPDSCMYQIPFAALTDDGGDFVSEIFRLRIVPY